MQRRCIGLCHTNKMNSDQKELEDLVKRINRVKTGNRSVSTEDLSLLSFVKSNYLNQLLLYILLYRVCAQDQRQEYLQKISDNMFILGFSEAQIFQDIRRVKASDEKALISELMMMPYLK